MPRRDDRPIDQRDPHARALVLRRRRVEHTCIVCGRVFVSYPGARMCSDACRLRHWRAQRRAETQYDAESTPDAP